MSQKQNSFLLININKPDHVQRTLAPYDKEPFAMDQVDTQGSFVSSRMFRSLV